MFPIASFAPNIPKITKTASELEPELGGFRNPVSEACSLPHGAAIQLPQVSVKYCTQPAYQFLLMNHSWPVVKLEVGDALKCALGTRQLSPTAKCFTCTPNRGLF